MRYATRLAFKDMGTSIRLYPHVGIPVDVKTFDNRPFHVVGEKYINAVGHGCNCLPVLLPAMGKGSQLKALTPNFEIKKIIDGLDGLFLPGSVSNVHPSHYGGTLETPDLPVDHQRDTTTLTMIHAAIELGVPLFAVCRGFQELNVAMGGSIYQKVHDQAGYMDHREDSTLPTNEQYAHAHEVSLTEGGLLHSLWGNNSARVNSLHGQGINKLGQGLIIEAQAPDSLIEAVSVENSTGFTLGVQWHPEWQFWQDDLSKVMFDAFSGAVRQRYQKHNL